MEVRTPFERLPKGSGRGGYYAILKVRGGVSAYLRSSSLEKLKEQVGNIKNDPDYESVEFLDDIPEEFKTSDKWRTEIPDIDFVVIR